ncbi:MAG: hypothetical protein CSA29_04490 [Desulfobacterales bacterium]|nr:MAG: hypothetical protein CSA29_04490 [Desulfobacterales bacterium]
MGYRYIGPFIQPGSGWIATYADVHITERPWADLVDHHPGFDPQQKLKDLNELHRLFYKNP